LSIGFVENLQATKKTNDKKMKTLKNYVNANPSGEIVGNVINWIMGLSGALFVIYAFTIQVMDKLF